MQCFAYVRYIYSVAVFIFKNINTGIDVTHILMNYINTAYEITSWPLAFKYEHKNS